MSFPNPHIHHLQPLHNHTHTAILLHGRGSDGPEFAEELFSSSSSPQSQSQSQSQSKQNLPASLPHWRWVFPSAKERWDSRFEEDLSAWFEAYSLADIEERQELQVEGLRESGKYILEILEAEIRLVGGDAGRVFLGGMSQGMAMGLWAFFFYCAGGKKPLGGVLGFCGWLPFGRAVEDYLVQQGQGRGQIQQMISAVLGDDSVESQDDEEASEASTSLLSTPVFLSHGEDDAFVPVELGRQAARILQQAGIPMESNEFVGAENEGHWIKEPGGFDRIVEFLGKHSG